MFRKDALNGMGNKWRGKVLLLSGVPPIYMYMISLVFTGLFILFLIYGTYTRRINVIGEISTFPRVSNVSSGVQGVITKEFVSVGQKVIIGDPIYQIDISKSTKNGVVSQNQRKDIKNQLNRIDNIMNRLETSKKNNLAMLEKQKLSLISAFERSSDIVERAKVGVDIMKKNMDSYLIYQKKGLINKDQLTNQIAMYYQHQNNLLGLSEQSEKNAFQLIEIENQINIQSAEYDNQISQMELRKYDLKKELISIDAGEEIIVRSLSDGVVDSLSVTVGQMVNSGDSLFQIIPNDIYYYALVLWIPNEAIPYMKVGDLVNIHYDAFPIEKFGQFSGEIKIISKTPASYQEMLTYQSAPKTKSTTAMPFYKVIIKPEKQLIEYGDVYLKLETGMKAESVIFLEKRKIYEWMFSPIYNMKKSLAGPINE